MSEISWVAMLIAVGLGLGVGALILGAGLWLDRTQGRWERGHDTDGS